MRRIYHFLCSIVYFLRCLFLGIKYKKGVKIRKGVKRGRGTKIILSENCWLGENSVFWGGGTITLGSNTHIGSYSSIYASKEGGVTFGNNVNCARNLFLIDASHSYNDKTELICKQKMIIESITIGNNVWIGANCTILKGVSIGDGCVIGACALVNKKYGDNVVIGGVPAKIIKYR